MSHVRYTNKKTGVVTVYESTSHYDPITKQSRPIRKYLGIEDPETGEIIPTSGKRGRKKATDETAVTKPKNEGKDYKLLYENEKKEKEKKDVRIKELESKNKMLLVNLERMKQMVDQAIAIFEPSPGK